MFKSMYVCVTKIKENETMNLNLKENKLGCMGEFGGRKGKERMI